MILVILVPLTINHSSLGYGGGGGWNTLDPRVCGDKLCSEIPGGRSAWEAKNEPIEQENKKNSLHLPPRQQVKNGIVPADVTCKESLKLIFKARDNSPACVKPESIEKLIERGWALETSSIESFEECVAAGNPVMESYPRQCRTPDGKHFVESLQQDESPEFEDNELPITSHDCSGSARCFTGSVTKIIDGDTIEVDGEKIRLSLTNTPETYQDGFHEATVFTKSLCPERSIVTVDQDDLQPHDVYNRILGKVICDGKNLNAELLYNGYANILTKYCSTSEFSNEDWAKEYGC